MSDDRLFACPRCHAGLVDEEERLLCLACGAPFPVRDGVPDFAPALRRPPGLAQRFMESRIIVAWYDCALRSAFIRFFSKLRLHEEQAYLHRWSGREPGPILDLACGTGRYTRWFAKRMEESVVVGVDVSDAMLSRARAITTGPEDVNILFARASAEALPFPDGGVSAVNCSAALHLFPDPPVAIKEVGRVLAPGGTFTGSTLWRRSWGRWNTGFFSLFSLRFFDEAELREWLAAAGLTVLDVSPRQHVVLLAARKN